jgi:hypothetical protein
VGRERGGGSDQAAIKALLSIAMVGLSKVHGRPPTGLPGDARRGTHCSPVTREYSSHDHGSYACPGYCNDRHWNNAMGGLRAANKKLSHS